MPIDLSLSLDRVEYLHNESIVAEVRLVNGSNGSIELPMLSLNDSTLVFVLRGEDDAELGRYSWVDVQKRLSRPRPTKNQATLHELAPSEGETLRRDLHLLREPLAPGRYQLEANFEYKKISASSA